MNTGIIGGQLKHIGRFYNPEYYGRMSSMGGSMVAKTIAVFGVGALSGIYVGRHYGVQRHTVAAADDKKGAMDQAKEKAQDWKDSAGDKAQDLKKSAGEKWDQTKDKAKELKDSAADKAKDVKDSAADKMDQAKEKIHDATKSK